MRWLVFWRKPQGTREGRWILSYGPAPGRQRVVPREVARGPEPHSERAANRWGLAEVARMEAESAAVEIAAALPPAPPPELTLAERRDKWLENKAADERLSRATRAEYQSHLDVSILQAFGCQQFSQLDIADLRVWIRTMRKTLAPSTVRNRFSTLSTFWDDARAEGWTRAQNLAREPGVRAELPELPRYAARTIPIDDFGKLVLCADNRAVRRIRYLLAGLAGLCDGEIAGLRLSSARMSDHMLLVREAVAIRGTTGHATANPLKNKYRERQIPMHPVLAAALTWWIADGWEQHVCQRPPGDAWLVPRDDGKPWRPRSADLLREDLERAGVQAPAGFTFHSLRACFASWLEESGVGEACRRRLMGHRGGSTAAVHYTSAVITADRAAVALIPLVLPDLVPSLVPAALEKSHLRDLNPRPTVYEIVAPGASRRPDTLRSAHESPPSANCNGRETFNGEDSSAVVVPESGPLPVELVELHRGLRGLITPWDAMELTLSGLSP